MGNSSLCGKRKKEINDINADCIFKAGLDFFKMSCSVALEVFSFL